MPQAHISDHTPNLHLGFEQIRRELDVPETFPPDVLDAVAAGGDLAADGRVDLRDLPFVSIDPAGSRDLDQAFHLERRGGGFRFHYAIADVAAWVAPGGPIDAAARERGATVYCPDTRLPLHPLPMSEGSASLLPDQDRPAVVWTIDLDDHGATADVHVRRGLVRNRRALDYAGVQARLNAGTADDQMLLLREVGILLLAIERQRGGVSLTLPDQVVVHDGAHYRLEYGSTLDTERWNAQLSLCCGMAAASLMLDAGFGVLRTLPAPDPSVLEALRRSSQHLGVAWPVDVSYPDWVRTLDPSTDHGAALMVAASRTLRGAAYLAFDGTAPASAEHHAIAAPYAHVTAPLRRLVDRFATECALAAVAGSRPPGWVLEAFGGLDATMAHTGSRASAVDRACIDLVEAAILQHRIGDEISGVVTAIRGDRSATVQLTRPAVIAHAPLVDGVEAGDRVQVEVTAADPSTRTVRFTIVAPRRGSDDLGGAAAATGSDSHEDALRGERPHPDAASVDLDGKGAVG